jgi:Na+-driven multidrug efflux pump
MTPNKRMFLNMVATYGRSLFALACGLFSGRWALMALGEVDYGLFGVIGGLVGFIAFFNNNLASAIGRFYAYSVGQSQIVGKEAEGMDECRRWFNTALTVHVVVPLIVLIVGYPIGEWMVRFFLTIPREKVSVCVWVWRFVCASCFINMISVPVNAMYIAKQYIAELTIYSVATTALNACFLYFMASHPGEWLSRYAFWSCLLAIVPQLLILIRGLFCIPECEIKFAYMGEWRRIVNICSFAGWNLFAAFGSLLQGQGIAILVNKYFGPKVNAAMTVANTVNNHVLSLSSAMTGAFSPAITNACGAGDDGRMRLLAYRCCKFGIALALIFILPLLLEVSDVLRLWLKYPPQYLSGFVVCMLVTALVSEASSGHMIAVRAKGKVAFYFFFLGCVLICAFPLAWALIVAGMGPHSVVLALFFIAMVAMIGRVYLARELAGMSARYWFFRIVCPVCVVAAASLATALIPRFLMEPGFIRIIITSIVSEAVYFPLTWFLILDEGEKIYVTEKIKQFKDKFK